MNEDRSERPTKPGRTFTFSLGFGRRPPDNHPAEDEHDRATESPDDVGTESLDERVFSLEFEDGQLRVGGAPVRARTDEPAQSQPLPDLTKLGHMYEDTATVHRWLNRIILGLAIAIPVGLIVAGVATGEPFETVVWMGIAGTVIGAMIAQMRR